jgi:hypothetical protein
VVVLLFVRTPSHPHQVVQAIRILSLRQADLSPDCGPAGPLGYAAYAARLVGSAPASREARLLIRRAARAAVAALPPRARVAEAEALHLLIRHHCNTFGLSGRAGEHHYITFWAVRQGR